MNSTGNRQAVALSIVILMLLAALIHIPFFFGNVYGEQDTARLVNDALIWEKAGIRTEAISEYRYYICPGYIWLAKQIVVVSQVTSVRPAFFLNLLNLIAVVVIVIPVFLLFRRLAGFESAVLGTFFLLFVPTFWQSGLYGFPHLLALFFVVSALVFFDRYLLDEKKNTKNALFTGSLFIIAALLKADIMLSAVAMLGMLLYRKCFSWRQILVACGLVAVPVIVGVTVSEVLLASSPNSAEYMVQWNSQYSVSLWRFFSVSSLGGVAMSTGLLSVPVFLASMLYLLRKGDFFLVLLLITWFGIPLAFWVSRIGDSSRHHLQSSLPLALGIGIILARLMWKPTLGYPAIALLILLNYFAFPASSSTLAASGNLVGSAYLIRGRVSDYHRVAEQYAEIDAEKKVVFGTITNPYVDAEILYRADTIDAVRRYRLYGYDTIEIHYVLNGKKYISSSVRLRDNEVPAAIVSFTNDGFEVFSMEFDPDGKEPRQFDTLMRLDQPEL